MVVSFLGRWFGRGQVAHPAVEELQAELDRLAGARPGLRPLARWLRELLPELLPAAGRTLPALDSQRAADRLRSGIPLLRDETLSIDPAALRQRWQRACSLLAAQRPEAAALVEAVDSGRLDLGGMLAAVVRGRPGTVRARAVALGLDPILTTTLLRFTLFMEFTGLAEALAPLREGIAWDRGHCPTCGSEPLLGEFRGLDQSRFLRCGLCATGWEVPRQWCPYCGNRDHGRLAFLHAEAEETRYRASLCDACRRYLKMLSTLSALPPLHLLVADLATLHLDLAASAQGYTR